MKKRPNLNAFSRYLVLVLSVVFVTACFLFRPVTQEGGEYKKNYYQYFTGIAAKQDSAAPDELAPDRYELNLPEINQAHCYRKIEAESLKPPAHTSVRHKRSGYSGSGYIGHLPANTESALDFPVPVPQTQHYTVTVCAASDCDGTHALRINGNVITQFSMNAAENFVRITFYGVFMEKGNAEIAVDTLTGELDVDYIEISDDTSVYDADFSVSHSLCNPNASAETKRLYQFLLQNHGKHTLTGQYVSDPSDSEMELIFRMTGTLPVIRFCTIGSGNDRAQIDAAIDWNTDLHGMVGITWNWTAPDSDSVYAEDTEFSLQTALRNKDMEKLALLTPEEIERGVQRGANRRETQLLLQDIDKIAETLRPLAQNDIPVLWRPLPEAGGGWYWWGASGKNTYRKLWELIYHRLTNYHHLDNLIWVWNGQSAAYLVPENTYDIAALDIYLQPNMEYGSRYEQFQSLKNITGGRKLLALSECSALPNPEMMQLDQAVWSYFGLWYGEYLVKPDDSASGANYSSNDLYNLYNSDLALTLNDFLSLYQ